MRIDMMRRILFFVAAAMGVLCGLPDMNAQKASLSTDLLGYANFVTMNLDASYPVSRHWSINAGVKYNPGKEKKMPVTGSRHIWPESVGGPGMSIPVGGWVARCNTRSIIPAVYSPARRGKATGMVQEWPVAIPIC